MNAHATVADTGRAIRILSAEQVTAGAVLEQALRSTHGIEVLLHDAIGTVAYQAKHAAVTDAQRTEILTVADFLAAHVETLRALANTSQKDAA